MSTADGSTPATASRAREFSATTEDLGDRRFAITVTGELDLATLPRLREQLEGAVEARAAGLAIDLMGITFIDSVAIAAIVNLHRRLPGAPISVAIERESFAQLIFDVAGLDSIVNLVHTRHEAVAHARS